MLEKIKNSTMQDNEFNHWSGKPKSYILERVAFATTNHIKHPPTPSHWGWDGTML